MTIPTSPIAVQPVDDRPGRTTDKLLNREQLISVYGIHYSDMHFYRMERAGKFPRRIRLSHSRVAWLESEIEAWISKRAAARVGGAA